MVESCSIPTERRCIAAGRRFIAAERRCIPADGRCIPAERRCIPAERRYIPADYGEFFFQLHMRMTDRVDKSITSLLPDKLSSTYLRS